MKDSVVYFLLVNLLTIVIVMGIEGSNVHKQTQLSKMNRGDVEEIHKNFINDTDKEGNTSIRENTGTDSLTESNAKDGLVQRSNGANCSSSEFQCTNHDCVSASQRCDGIPQCGDKSDEYGCVIVANYVAKIYHSQYATYLQVCYNNMNEILADMLCSLSGQGAATDYRSFTDGYGTILTPQSDHVTSIVPGFQVSVGSCKIALIICKSFADSVSCQFEDANQCGYINHHPSAKWDQRSGHFFKIPQYDHTYGNSTGKFMVAYNSTDLFVYYNTTTNNVGLHPARLEYLSAILSSPREHFTTESCVYFYYYLNGTVVRPNPLSAQLLVYVQTSSGKRLAWYDHVNRTVNDWLKGWVSIKPGDASIIFQGKTVTATTVWPGVVALDDVSVISEHCPAYPDCGPDTFQCNTTRVCIPVDMQCDGGNDCVDGSDEEKCNTAADYQVKLINGDGSYGSIAIFYQGLWRPVCMSRYSLMKGNINIVELVCKKLSYHGRFQGAFVNSWHQPVQHAMEISCSRNVVDLSSCSMKLTETTKSTGYCYYYQAALCSHDECFSGEQLCHQDLTNTNNPSSKKCISSKYFCDGIPDCQGGTDELNCANCSSSEFECTNHDCVSASQRCDGIPQCGDKSDEYGCVIVADNVAKIYHSQFATYLPVCYNNMNEILADMLCFLSGQRAASDYISFADGYGTILTPQSDTVTSIVPGFQVSVGSCNTALIICTCFECGATIFDDSRLQKLLHGRDAVLGQLPWHVAIYKGSKYSCGGFIIHPNWILTAGHCLKDKFTYRVRVGAIEVEQYIPNGNHNHFYTASRSQRHPFYNDELDNDVGLLYTSQPIAFNDYVRPICIASRGTVEGMLNAGHNAECYVSGWGVYHNLVNQDNWLGQLQVVRVYLYQKDECDQIYTNKYGSPPQNITVCIDNQNLGSPACHGDSGGALICRNNYGRFEALGSLSWGYRSCFQDGYPTIYQLSYPHESWIEKITGLDFSDLTMDND